MSADPNRLRRLFIFAHAVVRAVRRLGDDYRATFALALRQRRTLMSVFSKLLFESERVARKRLQWLRRRKLVEPKQVRPRPFALVADLFAGTVETPAPT